VHFRQDAGQFVAKPLWQTTGDDQRLAAVLRLTQLRGFEDGIDAFFLGRVDERAGVDNERVGAGGIVGDFDAMLEQRAEHDFGVHQILGAAERDQAHARRALGCQGAFHRVEKLRERDTPKQSWKAYSPLRPCIGTMNRLVLVLVPPSKPNHPIEDEEDDEEETGGSWKEIKRRLTPMVTPPGIEPGSQV